MIHKITGNNNYPLKHLIQNNSMATTKEEIANPFVETLQIFLPIRTTINQNNINQDNTSNPTKFKQIVLISCMCNTFERMINKRLV